MHTSVSIECFAFLCAFSHKLKQSMLLNPAFRKLRSNVAPIFKVGHGLAEYSLV